MSIWYEGKIICGWIFIWNIQVVVSRRMQNWSINLFQPPLARKVGCVPSSLGCNGRWDCRGCCASVEGTDFISQGVATKHIWASEFRKHELVLILFLRSRSVEIFILVKVIGCVWYDCGIQISGGCSTFKYDIHPPPSRNLIFSICWICNHLKSYLFWGVWRH